MTFSLAGRDPGTGRIGYAIATSSVCVGGRVGAVTDGCVVFSQARTDPRLHAVGIATWQKTGSAAATLDAMREAAVAPHWRQLGVLAMHGEGLHQTGSSCLGFTGGTTGPNSLALGNFLGSDRVLTEMVRGFEEADGTLAERLIAGMLAGEAAGSERDPLQSASVVVLGSEHLKDVDIRVDYSLKPIQDLSALLADWLPKADAYRLRALDPDSAPLSSLIERHSA